MDRYHEEYHRTARQAQAIVESYSHLFPPAIASIADRRHRHPAGRRVAPIPLIQKVAIFASFWIVSIFVSVVTLHPIILSATNPPRRRTSTHPRRGAHGSGGARWSRRRRCCFAATRSASPSTLHRPVERRRSCSPSALALYRWHEHDLPMAHRLDDRRERRLAALGRSSRSPIALFIICPYLGLAAQGRRHDARARRCSSPTTRTTSPTPS